MNFSNSVNTTLLNTEVLHPETRKEQKFLLFINKCIIVVAYSRSKRANFLSAQIVAKGKNAARSAKTVSSSSQL